MATIRERREARAERLREWADKRELRAEELDRKAHDMASLVPFGQPTMPDHHSYTADQSYRKRMRSTAERAYENSAKAKAMNAKAGNIDAALASSIYRDAADACEAQRIKAYNLSCRRGTPDPSLLDDRQRAGLESVRRVGQIRENGAMPAYALTNMNARIRADKKRLAELEAQRD